MFLPLFAMHFAFNIYVQTLCSANARLFDERKRKSAWLCNVDKKSYTCKEVYEKDL